MAEDGPETANVSSEESFGVDVNVGPFLAGVGFAELTLCDNFEWDLERFEDSLAIGSATLGTLDGD